MSADLVDEVAAEVERRQQQRAREAREGARVHAPGCSRCGVTRARRKWGDQWWRDGMCGECAETADRSTDSEQRWRVVCRLLPREVTRWWVAEYGLKKVDFKWFSETPGAEPSTERFAYVDVEELTARLTAKPPGPQLHDGDPCPKCGRSDRWATETIVQQRPKVARTSVDAGGDFYRTTVPVEETQTWCTGCGFDLSKHERERAAKRGGQRKVRAR